MLLIGVGDLHITGATPENRVDNYPETQFQKVTYILDRAKEYDAVILSPGDLFDTPKLSYEVFQRYLKLFLSYKIPIYTVPGQHDLRYHTSLKNSPMYAAHVAGAVTIVGERPEVITPGVTVQGAGWNNDVPFPVKDDFNILLTHRMIVREKLWATQTGEIYGSHFLRQYKYDLVISGDNHTAFMNSSRNRSLFNMGSLMRKAIDQTEHVPAFVLFNTETRSFHLQEIPCSPAKSVFQLTVVEKEKERDARVQAFVTGLSEQKEVGLEFEQNLFNYCKENDIDNEITGILEECIAERA